MRLPPGMADPLFLHELALRLHMPVGEMCNRMSAHELTVLWPAYFERQSIIAQRERDAQEESQKNAQVPV